MAVKYTGEYLDPEGNEFVFEISSTSYVGSSTEVQGRCYIEYPELENIFTPIRGGGMKLELEASDSLDFSDLWTDQERVWLVTLERETQEIFRGFINPEGCYQDFVNDEWNIELDVVDGLGYLENLSYVDGSGNPYTGLQTVLQIIVNCLARTEVTLDIYTAVDLVYTGLSESLDVLTNAKLKVDRFVRDDGETIMDCKEVLESTLSVFGACISQYNGAWYVFRPSKLINIGSVTFFHYNSSGVLQGTDSETFDLALGSFANGFDPHWANKNQRIYMRNSLGAFRVHYEYGLDDSLFDNPTLEWGSAFPDTPVFPTEWNELVPADVNYDFVSKDYESGDTHTGFKLELEFESGYTPQDILETDPLAVSEDDALTVEIDVYSIAATTRFYIELDDGFNTYRPDPDDPAIWEAVSTEVMLFEGGTGNFAGTGSSYTIKVDLPPMPETGDLKVVFQNPTKIAGVLSNIFAITGFKIYPTKENNNIQGEFHTVERTTAPSSKTDNVLKVYNGDNPSNIYYGTIYKADGATQTSTWNRKGEVETLPLLQILAEDRLRAAASPTRLFEGDIYGYISYLATPTLNGVSGVYAVIYYQYDTKANIITLKLRQTLTDEIADVDYQLTYDYGQTVKPTIKG